MKLMNFRCPTCGKEHEDLFTSEELSKTDSKEYAPLCKCGQEMVPHNFKNNSQSWQFNDNR